MLVAWACVQAILTIISNPVNSTVPIAFCMQSIRVPLTELQVGAHCARSQPAAKSKVVWMYEQIFN